MTLFGLTPNFSITSLTPIDLFFMVSTKLISSVTTCIKSLSEDTIETFHFFLAACLAYVAIISSASNPESSIDGIPNAFTDSLIILNCGIRSSGGSPLLAL